MEWPPPSVVIRLYASIDGFNLAAAKVDCQTAKFNSLPIFPVSRGADKRSKHSCGLRNTSNKKRRERVRERGSEGEREG